MNQSPLLDAHKAAGARLQDSEMPKVLTFGDVPTEYRAATEACALFDESDRGLVRVRGEEAASFLHRLLANDVKALTPGQGNRNLLLTPKGKILFDVDLAVSDDAIELSTPAGAAPRLLAALDMYLFADAAELSDATEEHSPLAICGPEAKEVLSAVLSGTPPAEDHGWASMEFQGQPVRVSKSPVAGSPGFRIDPGPARVQALWTALTSAGASPFGRVTHDILRVEAGAALAGEDIDENIYPQEARLEPAFSLDKGCYIGQEVVAKIDTYGGLNKRLVALRIEHDDPIARGTAVVKVEDGEERELGLVTSWAYSFVLDTGLALAYLKKRHQEAGMEFLIGGAKAVIVDLPVR